MPRFLTAGRLGLFIVTTVPLCHISEAVCDVDFDKNAWAPREAYEATFAGNPKFTLPPIGSGFNRTLDMEGFCNNILWKPKNFQSAHCPPLAVGDTVGEFIAEVTGSDRQAAKFLKFDGVNCPLKAVALRKNPVGSVHEAEIRFQFEECKAAAGTPVGFVPPVNTAAVTMGLRKINVRGSNLAPWMKEVCKVQTTTPAAASISLKEKVNLVQIGTGECKATGSTDVPNIATELECRAECKLSIDMAGVTGKEEDKCTGFAFRTTPTAKCVHYTGEVKEIVKEDKAWTCFSMSLGKAEYEKTVAQAAEDQAVELTENLKLREAMAGAPTAMSTAKLFEVKSDEACFPTSWWFMIQDDMGVPASLPVMENEWAALMAMIPEPQPWEKASAKTTVAVDRVAVKTCNDIAGWGRSCVMPEKETLCDNSHMINAIVTGIVVPVIGWLLVYGFQKKLPGSCMAVQGPREVVDADTHDEGRVPTCKLEGLITTCLVAVIVCGGLAMGSSFIVNKILAGNGCEHSTREMLVIGCAAGIPGAMSFVIGLLYIYLSGHRHNQSKGTSKYAPQQGKKLMLMEVSDGAGPLRGRPINPDILQTGTSAMASYNSGNHPQMINIDTTAQDIAAYQSGGGGSMMSTMRPGGE